MSAPDRQCYVREYKGSLGLAGEDEATEYAVGGMNVEKIRENEKVCHGL